MIHPAAFVDPRAELGSGVTIEPGALLEAGVRLGDGCRIGPGAVLRAGTFLGAGVSVDAGAVLGGLPQDLHFDPATPSGVSIGDGAVLREHVTVNRSTRPGGQTVIGPGAYLMAHAHAAHDVTVGEKAILANNVMLAGHVSVGPHAFLGGGAGIHQFVRIGEGVMVSGLARITRDLAPFLLVAERDEVAGLNLVGLKRRRFTPEEVTDLKACYHRVYGAGPGDRRERAAAARVAGLGTTRPGHLFLEFFEGGKRGFA